MQLDNVSSSDADIFVYLTKFCSCTLYVRKTTSFGLL